MWFWCSFYLEKTTLCAKIFLNDNNRKVTVFMKKFIDLRSDTVTQPTEEMRKAMFEASVGDDVYGEDTTMIHLEKLAAEIVGKEAALFVPSGTMGNQLGVMTHTKRGDEIILGENAHIKAHEVGAAAVISSVSFHTIKTDDDIITAEHVKAAIRDKNNIHFPNTGLICIENALATGGIVPVDIQQKVYALAKENEIPVHMDGARIFNAALALGVDAKDIAKNCDSVMFCLSKGLCAPVGSILAGSKEFIARARKNRKILGGGMRQCGFLAAAGIVALEKMTKRLGDDHANAKYMANEMAKLPHINLDIDRVKISMVFFKIAKEGFNDNDFIEYMLENGVKINGIEDGEYRFVAHNDVTKEDINKVIALLKMYLEK